MYLLGISQLPQRTWAAPAGMPQAIQLLESAATCFPEDLPRRQWDAQPSSAQTTAFSHLVSTALQFEDYVAPVPKHCIAFKAGYPAHHFLAYVNLPCPRLEIIEEVELMCSTLQDHSYAVPTSPQLADGAGTFVVVPNWTDSASKTVFVLDFSYWGGPVFALLDWCFTTRASLAPYARLHTPEPWDVFCAQASVPLTGDQHVQARPGDVFRFLPEGAVPTCLSEFDAVLCRPGVWQDPPRDKLREAPSSRWYAMRSHVTRMPHYAGGSREELQQVAANAFDTEQESLAFAYPKANSPLHEIVHNGYCTRGALAATASISAGQRLNKLVFVDPRPLGIPPFSSRSGMPQCPRTTLLHTSTSSFQQASE